MIILIYYLKRKCDPARNTIATYNQAKLALSVAIYANHLYQACIKDEIEASKQYY